MHFLRPDPLCQSVTAKPVLTVRDYWLLALLTAGALVLRLIGLNEGLWFDEIITLMYYVPLPVQDIIVHHDARNNHMFYSILAHLSWLWLGESAWSIRLPAALLGTATIPAAYYLGLQLANRRQALVAATFLLASYHHVWYSQSARGYSGVLFAAVLLSIIFIRLLDTRKPSWGAVALYAIVAALGTWIHLTAAMIVMAHALIWVGVSIKDWRGGIRKINSRAAIAIFISGLISLGLHAQVLESQANDFIVPVAKRAAAAAKATAVAAAAAATAATTSDSAVDSGADTHSVATIESDVDTAEDVGFTDLADHAEDAGPSDVADQTAIAATDNLADAQAEATNQDGADPGIVSTARRGSGRTVDPAAAAAVAAKRIGNIIVKPSTPGKNWMYNEVVLALSLAVPGGTYVLPVAALVLVLVIPLGLWSYARQGWLSFGILMAPFVVIVTLFVLLSQLMFPRFLLSCAVFLLLIGVRGGFVLMNSLVPTLTAKQVTAIGLTIALASALTVPRAWQPKQDYQDAFDYLEANFKPGDALVCSRNMYFMFYHFHETGCEPISNGRELLAIEATHARTWYVHTLQFGSRGGTRLWKRLKTNYSVEKVASSTVNRGNIYIMLNDGSARAE